MHQLCPHLRRNDLATTVSLNPIAYSLEYCNALYAGAALEDCLETSADQYWMSFLGTICSQAQIQALTSIYNTLNGLRSGSLKQFIYVFAYFSWFLCCLSIQWALTVVHKLTINKKKEQFTSVHSKAFGNKYVFKRGLYFFGEGLLQAVAQKPL